MYPSNILEVKAKEASDDARNALIMAVIGIFCLGFILGFLAFRKASNAIKIIDTYEVAKDKRGLAMGAKILGIVDIIGWAVGLVLRFAT